MKNFGFGCMRLPVVPNTEGEIDQEQFNRMVDTFLAAGFTYFDTAHVYHKGKSELALREGLAKRHPRESYILTDKLTSSCFEKEEDIRPLVQEQLEACGVEYFDYFLIHAVSANNYPKYQRCRAFEIAQELKAEGKVRHVGLSFHDTPELLEQILTEHPEVEAVQIQFNWADYDAPNVQSKGCYDVCRKFDKPMIIMEPVKGGSLADLMPEVRAEIADIPGSDASVAIRYAASFEGVFMVLSGMSNMEQMEDNIGFMKDFQPLTAEEIAAVDRAREVLKKQDVVPCTSCRYCVEGCPKHIPIPELLGVLNSAKRYKGFDGKRRYAMEVKDAGRASECIRCHKCENTCPQHLNITKFLADAAAAFEEPVEG